MGKISGLTVRQHERADLRLDIEFAVAKAYQDQVRFSPKSSAKNQQAVTGVAIDVSSGGAGWESPHYLPRLCEGSLRIFNPEATSTATDGSPIHEVIFEHKVKVRRVIMQSHDPVYSIGVSFVDPEPEIADRVASLMRLVGAEKGEVHG